MNNVIFSKQLYIKDTILFSYHVT